jgi:hypothetical protein
MKSTGWRQYTASEAAMTLGKQDLNNSEKVEVIAANQSLCTGYSQYYSSSYYSSSRILTS